MEEAAGTLLRRGTSLFPVEARAGHGLCHRGKAVPLALADHGGRWLGVPSADQRGRWLLVGTHCCHRGSVRGGGAGAGATLLGWVRVAVVVVVGLVRTPKGGSSCGGPPASRPVCSSSIVIWSRPMARLAVVGEMALGVWLTVVLPLSSLNIPHRPCCRSTGYDAQVHNHRMLAAVARRWWGGAVDVGPCSTGASPAVGSASMQSLCLGS